jgi:hypothetical protein
MSFDDEFGGFLDRETVLGGGVPAKRANTLLFLIESRTAHLVVRSRQAMELFLTQARASPRRENTSLLTPQSSASVEVRVLRRENGGRP